MTLDFCNVQYVTCLFNDATEGFAALELNATSEGESRQIGRITFWDAAGQFYIEMTGPEIPLEVLEKFIVEAKRVIQTS